MNDNKETINTVIEELKYNTELKRKLLEMMNEDIKINEMMRHYRDAI